ncbi:hypothetical protein Tco_0747355 [Tanacetum coccineum]|uniref:Uncharacterized protein n=1 Tax=Tanacetum coccineum TaxID=301880 RepID=A0ABQ4YSI2_9ASTR
MGSLIQGSSQKKYTYRKALYGLQQAPQELFVFCHIRVTYTLCTLTPEPGKSLLGREAEEEISDGAYVSDLIQEDSRGGHADYPADGWDGDDEPSDDDTDDDDAG